MTWHVLDVRAIWVKEFAAALGSIEPVLGWEPILSKLGRLRSAESGWALPDPSLHVRRFPLQRGFARFPVDVLAAEGRRIATRLRRAGPANAVLVCTSPHYAGVARRWEGPVVYYVTDLFVAYGQSPAWIRRLDERMCAAADLVCPNSRRTADYLVAEASCDPARVEVVPNATREANLLPAPSGGPGALPADAADLPRPVLGVIGNLGENTDWTLLEQAIERIGASWVFVGSPAMPIAAAMV